jgi:SAM-dependent methyltransferase
MDAESYRADSRDRWEQAAKGWTSRREHIQRSALPVSARLIERAALQPGHEVLEVAAGLGDTGLLAADLVKPGGRVVITDGADAMVESAQAHVKALGADNVEVRQMEAEWLDVTTASFDVILSRWGYMLLADPEAALREARRGLRPGGRIALAVWAPMTENPWIGVVQRELLGRELASPPEPGAPGMFALAAPGALEELLAAAGFSDAGVEPVDFTWNATSLDAWWDHQRTVSISLGAVLAGLTPAEHYELRDAVDEGYAPYVADDGSVALPARSLVASADA